MKRITAVILIASLLSGFCVTASADMMPDYFTERLVHAISEDGAKDIRDPEKILPYGRSYLYNSYYKDKNGNIIVVIKDGDSRLVYPSSPSDSATSGDASTSNEPVWSYVETEYHIRIEDLSGRGVEDIKDSESGMWIIKHYIERINRFFWFVKRWFMSLGRTFSLYK